MNVSTSPRRILVVDDDPLILKAMRLVLESDRHVVATACGGDAGITAFETAQASGEPYDVVMTDLNMPAVDGREVARAVKTRAPQAAVLLMTGSVDPRQLGQDAPGGVDMVLAKPPTRMEIRAALRELETRLGPQ
jgi:CheY-like chemotaxis protein